MYGAPTRVMKRTPKDTPILQRAPERTATIIAPKIPMMPISLYARSRTMAMKRPYRASAGILLNTKTVIALEYFTRRGYDTMRPIITARNMTPAMRG